MQTIKSLFWATAETVVAKDGKRGEKKHFQSRQLCLNCGKKLHLILNLFTSTEADRELTCSAAAHAVLLAPYVNAAGTVLVSALVEFGCNLMTMLNSKASSMLYFQPPSVLLNVPNMIQLERKVSFVFKLH